MGSSFAVTMALGMATIPLSVFLIFAIIGHRLKKAAPRAGKRPGILLTLLLAMAAGLIVWLMWLSWDNYSLNQYGHTQGPYQPWQVVACGITMVVVTIAIGLYSKWPVAGPYLSTIGATWGFSVAWGIDAFSMDDTGLSGVGFIMVLLGVGLGLGLISTLVAGIGTYLQNRLPSGA
ncbi:hypothetical protein SFC07_05100 [Corynebacterium callunae]|uniref:hypothetical protein n=1 Tax=Corynebacterium callunae TaxID=1721 RepID=UPI003981D488